MFNKITIALAMLLAFAVSPSWGAKAPANVPPTVAITSPASGATFLPPATISLAATAADSDGNVSKVEFYRGTTLIGSSTAAPYTLIWTNVAAGTYSLTAKATDNSGATTTSAAVSISVAAPKNVPPTVAITSPSSGATFVPPASIAITATAADSDGKVAKVEFYKGTTLIGSSIAAPYTFTWNNVAAGTYSLTAKATDDLGATTTSAATSISVSVPANVAPTVAITSPSTGATFLPSATIAITATAADSDGKVAKVEFYQGATLIGSAITSPYTITWSNVAAGTYSLTAKATDNVGATTTSAAASILVSTPKTVISSPANGATVSGTGAIVTGTYLGDPATTAVWLDNGNSTHLATLSGNNFSATVPVFVGTNTVTISVARVDKTFDSATLTIIGTDTPKIAFTAPASTSFNQPANVTFAVDAISPGGSIKKVDFYNGSTLLSSVSQPPFQYVWNSIPVGNFAVTAQAVDALGATAASSKTISVIGSNIPPTVSLVAATNGATPANVTLSATAADADGTIARVEFYRAEALVGSTNVPPYTLVLPNVSAGSYSFTAKATDNGGSVTTSAPANLTVADQLPVIITSPAPGASFTVPAAVNLAATVDGTALVVSFYNTTGGTEVLIGNSASTASPYALTWNIANAGTYTVIAKGTFRVDGFANPVVISSVPVTVTVAPNLSGETITFLHNDFAGSVIAATDVNGAVLWKEDYKPYGERVNNNATAAANRQFYSGKPLDADTGLSYFGARYYDPAIGRFMGIDPVDFQEDNIHSFNRYAYGNNNPYRYIDPDGRQSTPNMYPNYDPIQYMIDFATESFKFITMVGGGGSGKALTETGALAINAAKTTRAAATSETVTGTEIIMTSPKNLIPTQTKAEMSGSQIKRLAKDMEKNGFDQSKPISAQPNARGRLEITDGHHRREAAIKAGIEKVPVEVPKPQ